MEMYLFAHIFTKLNEITRSLLMYDYYYFS